MNSPEAQKKLLEIVETWRINEIPEYRGFRCANCQQYKNQAWYHWLNSNDYKLPVHMCNEKCEKEFQAGAIITDPQKRVKVNRNAFQKNSYFKPDAIKRFGEIVASWSEYKEPQLKAFSCDECGQDLDIDATDGQRKGFHIWWKMPDGKTLTELHFHKKCAKRLGINNMFDKS